MTTRPDRANRAITPLQRAVCATLVAALGALTAAPAALAEQRDMQGAYQQWERLSPQQRERILQEQQRFRRLPPSEQERLRREYEQRHQR
jgi:predicted negative regulator of RcsB-dependent stress response